MLPPTLIRGLGMIFLGCGALGACQVSLHVGLPHVALGCLLGALPFLGVGTARVARAL